MSHPPNKLFNKYTILSQLCLLYCVLEIGLVAQHQVAPALLSAGSWPCREEAEMPEYLAARIPSAMRL